MKKWFLKNKKADFKQISKRYKINEVIARLIVNRNIKEDNIRRYLYPSLDDMYNPFSMKDMEKGVQILKDKIETKERILIVGDYDVALIAGDPIYVYFDILLGPDYLPESDNIGNSFDIEYFRYYKPID